MPRKAGLRRSPWLISIDCNQKWKCIAFDSDNPFTSCPSPCPASRPCVCITSINSIIVIISTVPLGYSSWTSTSPNLPRTLTLKIHTHRAIIHQWLCQTHAQQTTLSVRNVCCSMECDKIEITYCARSTWTEERPKMNANRNHKPTHKWNGRTKPTAEIQKLTWKLSIQLRDVAGNNGLVWWQSLERPGM